MLNHSKPYCGSPNTQNKLFLSHKTSLKLAADNYKKGHIYL